MSQLPIETFTNYSVSHGTLREDDLIAAFGKFIIEAAGAGLIGNEYVLRITGDLINIITEPEEKIEILNNNIFDLMDEISPDGCYFGAHPGDGSDFGWWDIKSEEDE